MITTQSVLVAALGASLQELIYWYDLRRKMGDEGGKLAKLPSYWLITALMIVGSAFGTAVWYVDSGTQSPRTYLLVGAAFPLLLKKAVSAFGTSPVKLGSIGLMSYFRNA